MQKDKPCKGLNLSGLQVLSRDWDALFYGDYQCVIDIKAKTQAVL